MNGTGRKNENQDQDKDFGGDCVMKKVVLGLLGLGNIGGGVWDLIREFGSETAKRTGVKLIVKKALVLDKRIHGGKEVPDEVLTTD